MYFLVILKEIFEGPGDKKTGIYFSQRIISIAIWCENTTSLLGKLPTGSEQ